jgi:hypothetical protein
MLVADATLPGLAANTVAWLAKVEGISSDTPMSNRLRNFIKSGVYFALLTADGLKKLEVPRIQWDDDHNVKIFDLSDGTVYYFQRDLNDRRRKEIVEVLKTRDDVFFQPILVVKIGHKYFLIDGQHRAAGHFDDDVRDASFAVILDLTNHLLVKNRTQAAIEIARANYLVHNVNAKKPTVQELTNASNTPNAIIYRQLERECNVDGVYIRHVVKGLGAGNRRYNYNVDNPNAKDQIPDHVVTHTKILFNLWKEGDLWVNGKADKNSINHLYSDGQTLEFIAYCLYMKRMSNGGHLSDDEATDIIIAIRDTRWNKKTGIGCYLKNIRAPGAFTKAYKYVNSNIISLGRS